MTNGRWKQLQAIYILSLVLFFALLAGVLGQEHPKLSDVGVIFAVEGVVLGFGWFVNKKARYWR